MKHESLGLRVAPLAVCARFPEEDIIWKLLRKGNSTALTMRDPFGVPPTFSGKDNLADLEDATQYEHGTCRIGVIAQMLIKAGGNPEEAFYPALIVKCAELLHVTKGEESEKGKTLPKMNS